MDVLVAVLADHRLEPPIRGLSELLELVHRKRSATRSQPDQKRLVAANQKQLIGGEHATRRTSEKHDLVPIWIREALIEVVEDLVSIGACGRASSWVDIVDKNV